MPERTQHELNETASEPRAAPTFPALRDPRYPVHRMADRLEPYLRIIVERFHPEKIILFGSQAHGQPGWDSDVDLLVIRDDMASESEGEKEILRSFWDVPDTGLSFTVLARTPERLEGQRNAESPFYQDILSKGVEVYAA